jgi:hypothetical protein
VTAFQNAFRRAALLPRVATWEESRFRLWIRPRNPNSRTDSPRAPSTRSLSTMRVGSFEARACLERSIPRGLHPAFLEPFQDHDRDSCDRLLLSNHPVTSTHDACG